MNIKHYFSVLLAGLLYANIAFSVELPESYTLREGDVLDVSVWGEETLKKEVKVLPDGSITFPLAGRVDVSNATTTEVEKRITEKLKTYLPDPQVTVVISSIEGNRVYVIGKVLKPGPILLISPMTVMQALSQAGGLDKFADSDDLKVLRTTKGVQNTISVDYDDLINGKNLDSNILLKTGDTILVP
ncbi:MULTISPECIES: polysaccharide biosynthesis/export family protein [Methylotenera]|uniref:polysaccharide biosynthesis/export family protein n=1 Tax=Methylotenera TaxID=359407 RepID=UPI000371DAC6|nr:MULTISPECIES: polysaccharide biosynthesis/export family protein [Methylotenera]